jgi:DNA-binding transcriptional regulator GbsR (MarR family)
MPGRREEGRDSDQQILDRLAKIEHKVDSIEQTNAFALRADAERHEAVVKKIFGSSRRCAQVYLAADGTRSVQEIARHLGMQRQNVGPDLKHLQNEGLLELTDSRGNEDIWAKKSIDRSLRVTKFLCREFGLEKNGLRQKGAKKKSAKIRKRK